MNEIIQKDLEAAFGVAVRDSTPVSGGWLNQKWRVTTDSGEILVKQYSHERFSRKKIDDIEAALQRQLILHGEGVPCPRIWTAGERIIRRPAEEIDYMAMDFAPGRVESPESVTAAQMESLGEATARMHDAFSRLPTEGVKGCPLRTDALPEEIHCMVRECPADAPEGYREMIGLIRPIVKRMDVSFLREMEQGIAHEDFTRDNMLFLNDRLSVMIDFDRNQYSFRLHDVGRAVLSLGLTGGIMDGKKAGAFVKGYRRHRPLSEQDVKRALVMSWLIEIPWWIQRGSFGAGVSEKVMRFVEEMRYLSENMSDFER